MGERIKELWMKEDYWAVWLGIGIVLMALGGFAGATWVEGKFGKAES